MDFKQKITEFSIEHYRLITIVMVLITLALGAFMPRIKVDTDPENMLNEHEPVRVFHDQMKQEFSLNDYVVLGVVNEQNPDGVFNIETLTRIHELTEFVRDMHDEDDPEKRVVTGNLISPGTVDAIEQAGSTDYDAVAKALRTKDVATPLGNIHFDKRGDATGVGFSMYQVQNGVYVELK